MYVKNFINYVLSNVIFPTSSNISWRFSRKTHVEEATIPGIQVFLALNLHKLIRYGIMNLWALFELDIRNTQVIVCPLVNARHHGG